MKISLIILLVGFISAKEVEFINNIGSVYAVDDSIASKTLIIEQIYQVVLDTSDINADPLDARYPTDFAYHDIRVLIISTSNNMNYVFYADPNIAGRFKIQVGDTLVVKSVDAYWLNNVISYLGKISDYTNWNSIPQQLNGKNRNYTILR